MSEMSKNPLQAIRPDVALAAAQNGAACWSRAFSHLTEGFMTAAKAQATLASQVFTAEPNGSFRPITPDIASDLTREWLAGNKAKQDVLLQGFRRINDDLTACFFAAAEDLTEGLNVKTSKLKSPAAATKPESQEAASAAEKKTTAAQ
jgi:hypothetical protein